MKAEQLYASQCYLGEGPAWDPRTETVYWMDINAPKLFAMDWPSRKVKDWTFDDDLSFVTPANDGKLLLAIGTCLHRFEPSSGTLTKLLDLEPGLTDHRCNDGIVDRNGQVWLGTTHREHTQESGALYKIDQQLGFKKMIDKLTISNGMAWSTATDHLYHIDSPTMKVESFEWKQDEDIVSWERTAIKIPTDHGAPDGMTMDVEGMLWIAHWGGYGVCRWDPRTGKELDRIDVPAPHVTSCAFIGPDLDHLVITTARKGMNDQAKLEFPMSGDLFIAVPGVKGLARYVALV